MRGKLRQVWLWHKPIDILKVALSMRSPSDVTGRAFNHAPDSLQDAARKRALCIGLDESVNDVSAIEDPMFSDDGQQHQWGVVLDTLGTMQQEPHPHSLAGAVAYLQADLLAELGEQVRRRQQLKPRRQKVPAAQRSEFQAHHDAQAKWIVSKSGHFQPVGY